MHILTRQIPNSIYFQNFHFFFLKTFIFQYFSQFSIFSIISQFCQYFSFNFSNKSTHKPSAALPPSICLVKMCSRFFKQESHQATVQCGPQPKNKTKNQIWMFFSDRDRVHVWKLLHVRFITDLMSPPPYYLLTSTYPGRRQHKLEN